MGKSRNERLRFLTLTSSPGSVGRNLNADFRTLKMRVLRKFHFKMKYWKIRTNEGNEALHIVYRVKFVPQTWLAEAWAEIHLSPTVDIRSLYETSRGLKGIVFYLIGNYLSKQTFERMSWGYSWVWRGFTKTWKHIIEVYGYKSGLWVWKQMLCFFLLVWSGQVRLAKFMDRG
jgi:hypothetical protein